MRTLRKTADGVSHVELCEVPVPAIGPGEVLMKVWAAGVCGS
jgi:NADPH:quinone reductase-like Zn-dependent oxidoreductase